MPLPTNPHPTHWLCGDASMLSRRISALQSLSQLAAEGWAARAPQAAAGAAPRWLSELAERKEEPQDLVYEGPFSGAVRRVKVGVRARRAALPRGGHCSLASQPREPLEPSLAPPAARRS